MIALLLAHWRIGAAALALALSFTLVIECMPPHRAATYDEWIAPFGRAIDLDRVLWHPPTFATRKLDADRPLPS